MALAPAELDRRLRAFRDACARERVRITPQRVEVFREVARSDEHPDAETVFARVRGRLTNVSLDTVYRTLSLLERLGLVSKVDTLCDKARFDARPERHHHFVCTTCGAVRDLVRPEWDVCPAPEMPEGLGEVLSVHVQLRGICATCAAKKRKGFGDERRQRNE